jgi:hypothetical protein
LPDVSFIYSDGNVLMFLANVMYFIFGLEALAYVVSLIAGIARTSKY